MCDCRFSICNEPAGPGQAFGAGDPPAPVGDPPTGIVATLTSESGPILRCSASRVPSGESPDGTGQWPVLPGFDGSVCCGSAAAMRNTISTRFGSDVT